MNISDKRSLLAHSISNFKTKKLETISQSTFLWYLIVVNKKAPNVLCHKNAPGVKTYN